MSPSRVACVVVVGDALLDVDVEGRVGRFAPDSVAPVVEEVSRSERPGGAALAATLAAGDDGVAVTLVTALGTDAAAAALRAKLDPRVTLVELPCDGAIGVKTRLSAGPGLVARHDQGGTGLHVTSVPVVVQEALAGADAVLVSDYGRGVAASEPLRRLLGQVARRRPLVWDPHPRGPQPVPGARVVTPNAAEAAAACGEGGAAGLAGLAGLVEQARRLVERWEAATVAVTLAARGALLASDVSAAVFPSTRAVDGDACGAGDRFASRVATALASGALPSEAVTAAVAAATEFVAGGGVRALARVTDEPAPDGAASSSELLAAVRARGGTVVATGGCFDLLHAGHLATLETARGLGDVLVVCLNSDDSVRRAKGAARPLQPAVDRTRVLRGLRCVDLVIEFEEDTPEAVLAQLRPDVWVKGGDYSVADLPETALVQSWGGVVVAAPYLPDRSTTRLVNMARA